MVVVMVMDAGFFAGLVEEDVETDSFSQVFEEILVLLIIVADQDTSLNSAGFE